MKQAATQPPFLQQRRHRLRAIIGLLLLGALTAGCLQGESVEADLLLDPTSGPSGTTATVTVESNQVDVPIDLSDGTTTQQATLDDTGYYETSWEFVGEPGDAVVLEVLGFDEDDLLFESRMTFTITDTPGQPVDQIEATDDPTEETEEETAEPEAPTDETEEVSDDVAADEQPTAAVDVEVTIDPATGPAGETATITVTGEPNAPVTLTVNGVGSTGGTTDANGVYTFETTFSGNDGDEIPVEAEVGVGADTRSNSATYTIDNPESSCSVTAEDLVVEQFHETGSLSPALTDANALSSIRVRSNACEFESGTYFVSISDGNGSGAVDAGDAFFIAPQPADGSAVEIGIERGGNYFLGVINPDDVATLGEFAGTPFDAPTRLEDGSGWQLFGEATDVSIQIVERSSDNPAPAFYNVDFGTPLMDPLP